MKIEIFENKESNRELLPQIMDRIFAVCKNDPNFQLKDEMEIVENKTVSLKQKIEKQNVLLSQSNLLSKDLLQRIEVLENQNERKQTELLEALGSDI